MEWYLCTLTSSTTNSNPVRCGFEQPGARFIQAVNMMRWAGAHWKFERTLLSKPPTTVMTKVLRSYDKDARAREHTKEVDHSVAMGRKVLTMLEIGTVDTVERGGGVDAPG